MALKMTGFTPETQRRLLYDSGIVYANYGLGGQKILGCTRGGNTASIEDEIRKMDFDGTPGDVKGDKRRVKVAVKLTVNLLEFSTDGILANLPGAENTPTGTHDVLTREDQISSGDYFDNITLVLQKSGTAALFGFKLKNALALGNFELAANDEDEAVNAIEFTAHYDPTDLDAEPWEIFNPLETPVTWYTLTYIAGANGAVIGNTAQTVAGGEDGTAVYAHPADGYVFVNWTPGSSTDNPRQDTDVAANVSVTANFAEDD